MQKKVISLVLIFILLFSFNCHAENQSEDQQYDLSSIMVVIKKEYTEFGKEYALSDFDCTIFESIELLNPIDENQTDLSGYNLEYWKHILKLNLKYPSEENIELALHKALENPQVESAEKNYITEIDFRNETSTRDISDSAEIPPVSSIYSAFANTSQIGISTNDQYFDLQYGLRMTRTTRAWAFNTGSSTVKIGIIDSGINGHRDVRYDTSLSKNFTDETGLWDNVNHGTHVAGIIRAQANNTYGISGVCQHASLINLKAYKESSEGISSTYNDWVCQAITYASSKSIRVLNLSGEVPNTSDLVAAIQAYNGILVCSAGNYDASSENDSITNIQYPSLYSNNNIISVASCDSNGNLATDSKYHPIHVDIVAPGVNIYSTINIDQYDYKSGTSMAAPFVTGAVALLLSINPNYTPSQLRTLILSNVTKGPSYEGKVSSGGRLNTLRAVLAAYGYKLGDVNMNQQVTPEDARTVLQFANGTMTYTTKQGVLADVNYDNSITAEDARTILRVAAQLTEIQNLDQEVII